MGEKRRILLVGHCWPDSFGLRRAASKATPDSDVQRVNSDTDLERELPGADLLLINRALDGRFESGDGVELIGRLAAKGEHTPPMLLVSDREEAQRRAEQAGARPGFGKRTVRDDTTVEKIRAAMGLSTT